MRKHRRKIKRKIRGKKRRSKRISHLDTPITNRWTKITTYFMILFEAVFILWYAQETMLYWHEIVTRFNEIINTIGGWF